MKKFLLLGSGELGKEFAIVAKRYGFYVIAVDHYENAPAMQIADEFEMIDMLDCEELDNVIDRHKPDYIVPEVESICISKLFEYEKKGYTVVPSAKAVNVTMNRKATRELATQLGFPTARYEYATCAEELKMATEKIGFPCVVKPLMSSSGKGQSVLKKKEDIEKVWKNAMKGSRGNIPEVIVEEFIDFDFEITLLTVTTNNGVKFCDAIQHIQSEGDFRESWQPIYNNFHTKFREDAQRMASQITRELGGNGVWGVEFFVSVTKGVIFSELSPRPHDTGMVTLLTQNQSEFELHLRAVLGWAVNPSINRAKSGAICAILADCEDSDKFEYSGLEKAAELGEFRIFGKPKVWNNRRIGIAFSGSNSSYYDTWQCRNKARAIAECIKVIPK